MSYYGLSAGTVFKVLSLYQRKGLALINVHEQTFLVRLMTYLVFHVFTMNDIAVIGLPNTGKQHYLINGLINHYR